jgi:hypothetical protein
VSRLAGRSEVARSPFRAPLQSRNRKRWVAVIGIAVLWALFVHSTGSMAGGTILLVLLAAAITGLVVALRYLGLNRDTELMDIGLVNSSATEVSRPPSGHPQPARSWQSSGSLPPSGSRPPSASWPPAGPWQPARPEQAAGGIRAQAREGRTHTDLAAARTVVAGSVTVTALAQVPLLRLATNGSIAETRISGARAGRSRGAELRLPEELTVSRVHAEFTCTDGRWHITSKGRNGVTLNGTPLTAEHPIRDGDCIGWGTQPGALVSRVEIGWDKALPAHGQR